MLEIIKQLLGIADNSKDYIIGYYIEKVSKDCVTYCKLDSFPQTLEGFVIEKVKGIVSNGGSSVAIGAIKQVSRGSTSISYETGSNNNKSVTTVYFTSEELAYLDQFKSRKLRLY